MSFHLTDIEKNKLEEAFIKAFLLIWFKEGRPEVDRNFFNQLRTWVYEGGECLDLFFEKAYRQVFRDDLESEENLSKILNFWDDLYYSNDYDYSNSGISPSYQRAINGGIQDVIRMTAYFIVEKFDLSKFQKIFQRVCEHLSGDLI